MKIPVSFYHNEIIELHQLIRDYMDHGDPDTDKYRTLERVKHELQNIDENPPKAKTFIQTHQNIPFSDLASTVQEEIHFLENDGNTIKEIIYHQTYNGNFYHQTYNGNYNIIITYISTS